MDAVVAYLNDIPAWHWLVLMLALLLIELVTGTLIVLWPAAAALVVAGLVGLPGPFPWPLQFLVFAVVLAIFAVAGEKFIRPKWLASNLPKLSSRSEQMVGVRAKVIATFDGLNGRVEAKGSQWRAVLDAGPAPVIGDWVTVTGVDGATLYVSAAADGEASDDTVGDTADENGSAPDLTQA